MLFQFFSKKWKILKKLDFAWFPFTFPWKCKGKSSEIQLFRDFSRFSKISRKKIWKIMKNKKFAKNPKFFVILVLRVIDFCRLEMLQTTSWRSYIDGVQNVHFPFQNLLRPTHVDQNRSCESYTGTWSTAKSWAAYFPRGSKKNLARLVAILAILLFFSARGTKMNRIEKKYMEKRNFCNF